MRKSGKIFDMPDGRVVVLYDEQPMIERKKILLHIIDDSPRSKTLIKDLDSFKEEIKTYKLKGFID